MAGRDERWTRVAVGTCIVAASAVGATLAWDGVHVEHMWIVPIVAVTIAALENHPLSVTPGERGRLYVSVSEVGLGLGVLWMSPAALALATAAGFVPTLLQRELPVWKRAFGLGEVTLGGMAVASVFDAMDQDVTLATIVVAALAHWTVVSVPILLMSHALGEPAIGRRILTTAPWVLAASAAALAAGAAISPLLGRSPNGAVVAVVAVAGVLAAVRVGHASAMRADRLRVLFGATIDLQRSGTVADLDALLWSLGPVLIPGATGLRLQVDGSGEGALVARMEGRGWLVADYGPGANPPGTEDAERLEVLASVVGDVLDQRDRLTEATREATTDAMTGLMNRRGLDLAMTRLGRPAAIAMVDLDRLKLINDTHGHAAGDAALLALGDALRSALRASDIAARTGGDEFVVVLPGLSLDDARPILERVSSDLARSADVPAGVTVSATIGLAEWSPHAGPGWAEVIDAADAQLYARRRRERAGDREPRAG